MTVVNFRRSAPLADGTDAPAEGYFRFALSRRRIVPGAPDNVITPRPFTVDLVAGLVSVTLAPSAPGWAWHVLESVDGVKDERYWIVVPDSAEPVDDTDLPRVDPSTLAPTAEPTAAWWPVANATITDAAVIDGDLIVTRHEGTQVTAGRVAPTPEDLTAAVQAVARPSNLALDLDGVPFISPGSNTVFVYADVDGRPYFTN